MLDLDSVSPFLKVSEDLQTVQRVKNKIEHSNNRHRFTEVPQVLSSKCFTSGTHIWEVEVEGYWEVAVAFMSIQRKIKETSSFGNNAKSWSLAHNDKGKLFVYHDKEKIPLSQKLNTNQIAVMINFTQGTITFSTIDNPVTKLYEFKAELTEPVCLGFGLYRADLSSRASILKAFRVTESPAS